ncbi:MAG: tRNA (adenosine(37)-N6)-threonylcarbamoyltransferase complex ATPase subunit type 1 TsaE [Planctomycetes bacterium]|nr:tRNA (adenosine(37)-N6)-threonylcarbamoyltransferase complex ATPase subunit type 1 TsaE [Planctomycetota bacterium]
MSDSILVNTSTELETDGLGRRLAVRLFPGAVIGLVGPLGAGKTRLVRAIASGLDIADARVVNSPTFVLIQEYAARLPIYHFDAYRLKSDAEFLDLGAHEYFGGQGVCLIEWADRVASCLPDDRLTIAIEITGATSRRFHLTAGGPRHQAIVLTAEA